jgi:hypothetical protein
VSLPLPLDAPRSLLGSISDWLTAHNRALMVVIGAVFGTWFVVKALDGLGVT